MEHLGVFETVFSTENLQIKPLSGGDINAVYSVKNANAEPCVVKINDAKKFPQMLRKEANGLAELGNNGLEVPRVTEVGETWGFQYLVLEYVATGKASNQFWENFGTGLAKLHQTAQSQYGLNEDNYIGSLSQSNQTHLTWTDFLVNERFIPQLKLARDKGIIESDESRQIERFFDYVDELWPTESPALLHGDLWSGNFIVGENDCPVLIDPAVYYGHREMDIGMMHLFGGFDPRLFSIYNSLYPLEKGWEERITFNQLYPLLVHLNLFGRSYFRQIQGIVNPFS